MEVHLSDILEGSGRAAMGRAPARVDVNGIVCGLNFCHERAVAEILTGLWFSRRIKYGFIRPV